MDPNIHEIITRFKQLDTSTSARRIAYHLIIDQLGPHEWRDVKKRLNERTFQKDILGALHLELAVEIVLHLDLADLYVLRRVSKRWREVLSSRPACNVLYRLYTGCTLDDNYESTLARFSKRRLRLEQGKPLASLRIDFSDLSDNELSGLDCINGRYVWVADDGTTLVVYSPETGRKQRFCAENRELVCHYRLSDRMVAMTTMRGYCHAWDLETEETHAFRLPNIDVSLFVVSGFSIVVYFPKLEGGLIMHFNLESTRTHNIQHIQNLVLVCLVDFSRFGAICLDREAGHQETDDASPLLYIRTFELDENGISSSQSSTIMDLLYDGPWPFINFQPNYSMLPCCRNNVGFLLARASHDIRDPLTIVPITYHPQTNRLYTHVLSLRTTSRPRMIRVDGDIIYYVRGEVGTQSIWVSNANARPHTYPARGMDLGLLRDLSGRASAGHPRGLVIIGDSRFATVIDETNWRVWSFEEVDQLENTPDPFPGYR
ncbi:hypothetical protein BDV06DRAFT_202981 [Aspergillus oleicola]